MSLTALMLEFRDCWIILCKKHLYYQSAFYHSNEWKINALPLVNENDHIRRLIAVFRGVLACFGDKDIWLNQFNQLHHSPKHLNKLSNMSGIFSSTTRPNAKPRQFIFLGSNQKTYKRFNFSLNAGTKPNDIDKCLLFF